MCGDTPIRGRVQRILDKIINTFRSSGNKMVSGAANKVKTSQEREKDKPERAVMAFKRELWLSTSSYA